MPVFVTDALFEALDPTVTEPNGIVVALVVRTPAVLPGEGEPVVLPPQPARNKKHARHGPTKRLRHRCRLHRDAYKDHLRLYHGVGITA